MYYASIGIISLIVLVIINLEIIKIVEKKNSNELRRKYHQYLLSLIGFFIADILWGFFYEFHRSLPTHSPSFLHKYIRTGYFGSRRIGTMLPPSSYYSASLRTIFSA